MKVYTYAKCSTCRDAVKWLESHGVAFEELPIKETPPTKAELRAVVTSLGGNLKRVFNTSGMEYRKLGIAERWDQMSEDEALGLLTNNGMLVKRPLVVGNGFGLAGFDPEAWASAINS